MTLPSGTRLGPYELLALHGAGGMGEVYRARDTRLERTVAVKVLPRHLGEDPVLRARLEREARAISALSHPNICALFDVGNQDGVEYLVMEYLDGETLHERLKPGPLPVEQVLRIGIEIAAALEGAHRQGIIHRDLKPANIMLTKSGAKLLDFGLAKPAASPLAGLPMTIAVGGALSPPTDPTRPAPSPFPGTPLTTVGTILGTFHYMAPEQLEGRVVDARSDIFALGAVLYEMATGRRAFEGSNPASVIAAVLERQPQPITALQPLSPAGLDRLVRVCLAKDPDERWQSAHDVRAQLQGLATDSTATAAATPVPRRGRPQVRERWLWAALAATLAGLVVYHELRARAGPSAAVERLNLSVLPPPGITSAGPLALRPDGGALAFAGFGDDGVARLWLRQLDAPEARELPGTEDASLPFWSPDGKSLGFFAQRQLKRIEVAGGPPRVLTDVSDARGGTWGAGDVIVFAPNPGDGLYRVAAEGGAVGVLTRLDAGRGESSHRWPAFLPDGKHVLFLALSGQRERYTVAAVALEGGAVQRVLAADSSAAFAPPGHLLFAQGRSLLAQQFDPQRLKLSGQPLPLAERVWRDPDLDGLLAFSSAANGVVAYRSGGEPETSLMWFDRTGRPGESLGAGVGSVITLSPDGTRLASSGLDPRSGVSGISLGELTGRSFSRLTFNRSNDIYPVWSPDGRRLAFASDRAGSYDLYEKAVDGSGTETTLLVSEPWEFPEDWSRDGRYLVFTRRDARTRSDVWTLELADRRQTAVLATEADELQPRLSPDGRWLAYVSDASGRNEVYVQAMPPTTAKWQISTAGGFQPQWRRDGRELFYLAPSLRLMAAAVSASASGFTADKPQALFQTRARRSNLKGQSGYLATPDGRRFLIDTETGEDVSSPIHLLLGWAPPS